MQNRVVLTPPGLVGNQKKGFVATDFIKTNKIKKKIQMFAPTSDSCAL